MSLAHVVLVKNLNTVVELYKELKKTNNKVIIKNANPNKTFLDPEDFSDSVRGLPEDFDDKSGDYVNGEWQALGIQSGEHEGQSFNDYPMLYSILRKFPYKTLVSIMTVGPNTKIGNHTDNEGGWRYQLCLDDGGGDQSGMYVMDLENKVDSFVDHFLQIHSNIDEELLDYRNHGWVDDIKNFNTIFEEMANVSNDLYQNGHE